MLKHTKIDDLPISPDSPRSVASRLFVDSGERSMYLYDVLAKREVALRFAAALHWSVMTMQPGKHTSTGL